MDEPKGAGLAVELMATNPDRQAPLSLPQTQAIVDYVIPVGFAGPGSRLNIIYTHDDEMRRLNIQYRHKQETTDVLTFAYLDQESEWDMVGEESTLVGEIYFSAQAVERQAAEEGHQPYEEMAFLLIHSLLHLLGMDHETDPDQSHVMNQLQNQYFQDIRSILSDPV